MKKKEKKRAWIIWSIIGVLAMVFFSAAIEIGEYTFDCNEGEIIEVNNKSIWVCGNKTQDQIFITANITNGTEIGQVAIWNGSLWIGDTLEATFYNATSATTVSGTIEGGTIANTRIYDSITLNITESVGSPALDVRINFTNGITRFDAGVIRYRTSNLFGDYPIIQLWDYNSGSWEDYPELTETQTFTTIEISVFDDDDHVLNGTVQMRLYKASNGNANNKYYIDWVAISSGFGTPQGEEIDPNAIHKDGTNQPIADFDWNNYNITNIKNLGIRTNTPLAPIHAQITHDPVYVPNGNTDEIIEDTYGYPIFELAGDVGKAGGYMVRDESDTAGAVGGYLRYDLTNNNQYWSIWVDSSSKMTIDKYGNVTAVGNMVAKDFITKSRVADFSLDTKSLDNLNNAEQWLKTDGTIDYEKHYAYKPYTEYKVIGWDKDKQPIIERITSDGLSMETRVAEMEKMIYELNQEIEAIKATK